VIFRTEFTLRSARLDIARAAHVNISLQ